MTWTIWGEAQTARQVAPGIMEYETASHGGFHVSRAELATLPEALRLADGWYEEDCDCALLMLARPELFSPESVALAHSSARRWNLARYERWQASRLEVPHAT